jgi:hypothetical protein
MLIIVHSLWGLTLATQTQNIYLLLLGGAGGHILLDAIPHRDLTTVGQVIIDIIIAATFSLFLPEDIFSSFCFCLVSSFFNSPRRRSCISIF